MRLLAVALCLFAGTAAAEQKVYPMGGFGTEAGPMEAIPPMVAVGAAQACAGRASCRLNQARDAGTDAAGHALVVVELRFAMADAVKAGATAEAGCIEPDGSYDGGTEWHLLVDGKPGAKLLTLCNDGYGTAGIGEDEIIVTPNHITHVQDGGSETRWTVMRNADLSPLHLTHVDLCDYDPEKPAAARRIVVDPARAAVHVIAYAGRATGGEGAYGCPVETGAPNGGLHVVQAQAVPQPRIEGPVDGGFGIDGCGLRIAADGTAGSVVSGRKAKPGEGAEIWAVALGGGRLVIQVRDAARTPGRFDLFLGHGKVTVMLADAGEALAVDVPKPGLTATPGTDAAGHAVTRLDFGFGDDAALADGVALAYTEAGGRTVATSAFAHAWPALVPPVVAVETRCTLRDGRLAIAGVPEALAPADPAP